MDARVTLKTKSCILILKDTCFLLGSCGNSVSSESASSPGDFLLKQWGKTEPYAGYSQFQASLLLYFQMSLDTFTLTLIHPIWGQDEGL